MIVLSFFRWLKDQENKLPDEDDEDTIASLKEKEGRITVCFDLLQLLLCHFSWHRHRKEIGTNLHAASSMYLT